MTYRVYGSSEDGDHPSESFEMTSFFNMIRGKYPDTFGKLALHIRNEGKRSYQQARKMSVEGGFVKGASDVVIPGNPSFVMEMKSKDKSARLSKEQRDYLYAASELGAFACVAYGALAARDAFEDYLKECY